MAFFGLTVNFQFLKQSCRMLICTCIYYVVLCFSFHNNAYMAVSSAWIAVCVFWYVGRSLIYRIKRSRPRVEIWGTPAGTFFIATLNPFMAT